MSFFLVVTFPVIIIETNNLQMVPICPTGVLSSSGLPLTVLEKENNELSGPHPTADCKSKSFI